MKNGRRPWTWWVGLALMAGAGATLAWLYWFEALLVVAFFAGVGLVGASRPEGPRPENMAQVAEALHDRGGLTAGEAWDAVERIVAHLAEELPQGRNPTAPEVWAEARDRYGIYL